MSERETGRNGLGQSIGFEMPGWRPSDLPAREAIVGRWCRLDPLDGALHGEPLHAAYSNDADDGNWTYLPYGPFSTAEAYCKWVAEIQSKNDPLAFAIIDPKGSKPVGVATYLRIDSANGGIEVGHLRFSSTLQRTAMSTEAMYLMMRRAFDDWGYRRYEWKCDSLNSPSVAAAQRLGFRREGTLRNHIVMKGRNRDTTWFSILDREWAPLRSAFEAWLAPSNFDPSGLQKQPLSTWMPTEAGTPRD